MNDKYEYNRHFDRRRMAEIADILSTGYLRFRKDLAKRATATFLEKSLDDVADSARVGTGESRTLEKGATL